MKIKELQVIEAVKDYKTTEITLHGLAEKYGTTKQRWDQIFKKLRLQGVDIPRKSSQNGGLDYKGLAKKINENPIS